MGEADTGELSPLVMEPGDYRSFDLSPDEKQRAFTKSAARSTSVWVHELEKGSTVPWTFGDTEYTDPRWTNDSRLLATKWQPEPMAIVQISADGSQSVVSTPVTALDDVSLDRQYVLYRYRGLHAKPLGEGTQATLVRKAPSGFMDQAQFSPDTRWIAYHADETGRFEVYVTPFPGPGERQPISSGGAVQPMWRRDGRELYYLGSTECCMPSNCGPTASICILRIGRCSKRELRHPKVSNSTLQAPTASVFSSSNL